MGFDEAEVFVARAVLHHGLLRVETDAVVTRSTRLLLGERDQARAELPALHLRPNSDIVQQHRALLGDQYDETEDFAVLFQDMHQTSSDQIAVIVKHGTGRGADAGLVADIGRVNDLRDGGCVLSACEADHGDGQSRSPYFAAGCA